MAMKVLCVEDHDFQRETMAQLLELSGFEVAVAENGLAGVEMALTWGPDLIIMDLNMPVMDGLSAIRRLRAEFLTADTYIISITALIGGKYQQQALAAGANRHFSKPLDWARLVAEIDSARAPAT